MPLIVLAGGGTEDLTVYGDPPEFQDVWWSLALELQADLATIVPDGPLIFVEDGGHFIDEERPQVVIDTVRDVVNAVRDSSSWATPVASPDAGTPAP